MSAKASNLIPPIHRCPGDVLREIFEHVVANIPNDDPVLEQSVRLSSVCRQWRAIALDTPKLWNEIIFDLDEPMEILSYYRNIIPRIKHTAANVTIYLSSTALHALSMCSVQHIPVLGRLSFILPRDENIGQLCSPAFTLSASTLNSLKIRRETPKPNEYRSNRPDPVDVLRILHRFPPLTKLSVYTLSNLQFQGDTTSNLSQLYLDNVGQVEILDIFRLLPKLQSLTIRDATLTVAKELPAEVIASNVKYLDLSFTSGETWMTHTSFPELTSLAFLVDHPCTETFEAFLSANQSLRTLTCFNYRKDILKLADAVPQLLELRIDPPLRPLYSMESHDDRSELPFPHLRRLDIPVSAIESYLTLEDFEGLVRTRCLPMRHPRRIASTNSQVISTISTEVDDSTSIQDWQGSELYMEANKVTRERDGTFYTRLMWPDRD